MSDTTEAAKYKWTPESTKLLVSVWTDRQVQKQLEYSSRPQLIWESVAKYMNKKGYSVTGRQCRSRMKQVLVCYQEKKREGTYDSVEQYYDLIEKVLKVRKLGAQNQQQHQSGGVDAVDGVNFKSPPKELKTSKNLQVRFTSQKPVESMYRTNALSPIYRDEEAYSESPESSETVLAQPFRVFSPVRDAATNTSGLLVGQLSRKSNQENLISEEIPSKDGFRQNSNPANGFSEIPYQNAVQNVQNQIIQENMQQHQALYENLLQNQLIARLNNQNLRNNMPVMNHQGLYTDRPLSQGSAGILQNPVYENIARVNNRFQQSANINQAVPQEPRKANFRQNLALNHPQFQDYGTVGYNNNNNLNHAAFFSPSISPDIPININEAFCQQKSEQGRMNDAFTHPTSNRINHQMAEDTMLTNNATFNDETISIDFIQDSPSPENNEPAKQKDFAVNTEDIPDVPIRKKKAQKLEQLMLSAINSQSDVVNKILAAQNDMVSRVLDLDRDRQNRLETRLDHLLNFVQATVFNRSSEKGSDIQQHSPEPGIPNLVPPPKPGIIPPKLDLVPPKPCRVPCTTSGINQVNNQNPFTTRPGVVSPVMSPTKRVGTIWSKLGPVSTSPFVKAQQQLGFRPIHGATARTQSSAERRIARHVGLSTDPQSMINETKNFLQAERQLQECIQNARIQESLSQDLTAKKRLFSQREPSATTILTAAFLEAECQSTENDENARWNWERQRRIDEINHLNQNKFQKTYTLTDMSANRYGEDDLLAGQGESYERMIRLKLEEGMMENPCDTSTPAKIPPPPPLPPDNHRGNSNEPRPTVQQLAQLVMNSARWKTTVPQNCGNQRKDLNLRFGIGNNQDKKEEVILRKPKNPLDDRLKGIDQVDSNAKTLGWLQDRYSYAGLSSATNNNNNFVENTANRMSYNGPLPQNNRYPMGFTTHSYPLENVHPMNPTDKRMGFICDNKNLDKEDINNLLMDDKDPFEHLYQLYAQRQTDLRHHKHVEPYMTSNGHMIMARTCLIDRRKSSMGRQGRDTDSDDEYMDTTATMHPASNSRKNSLTSNGTRSGKDGALHTCIIS